MARILGVDFGIKHIGFAISDESQRIAFGLKRIDIEDESKAAECISNVAKENGVTTIVIGYPLNMDGSKGDMANRIKKLSTILEQNYKLNVITMDERLSTVTAIKEINHMKIKNISKKKEMIDIISARLILQTYLDKINNTQWDNEIQDKDSL